MQNNNFPTLDELWKEAQEAAFAADEDADYYDALGLDDGSEEFRNKEPFDWLKDTAQIYAGSSSPSEAPLEIYENGLEAQNEEVPLTSPILPSPSVVASSSSSEAVSEFGSKELTETLSFVRVGVPQDVKLSPSFVFATADFRTNREKVVFVVQSNEKNLRAGLWYAAVEASASMAPLLSVLVQHGYAVVVLNPNLNTMPGSDDPIVGSESPRQHTQMVLETLLPQCPAQRVVLLAHGMGCVQVMHILRAKHSKHKLAGHGFSLSPLQADIMKFLSSRCRAWQRNEQPLDTDVGLCEGIQTFSAGTSQASRLPESCVVSVVKYMTS